MSYTIWQIYKAYKTEPSKIPLGMSYTMDIIWQICKAYKTEPSKIPLGLLSELYKYGHFNDLVDYFEGRPVKSRENPSMTYLLLTNCGTKASNVVFDEFIHPFFPSFPSIDKVIFNGPATIVKWSDGTKTVVKCQEGDEYSKQTGLLMCVFKKAFGAKNDLEKMLYDFCSDDVQPEE